MQEMWRGIRLILETVLTGLADLSEAMTRVSGYNRSDAEVYFRGIRRFLVWVVSLLALMLGIAIAGGLGWLVSAVGLICGLVILAFSFTLAAPIGLLLTALSGGKTTIDKKTGEAVGFGERYVTGILTLLFMELGIAWYFSLADVSNYRAFVPTFLVAAVIVLLASTKWFKRIITFGAVATIIVMSFAFFMPEDFEWLRAKNEIRAQEVSFETFCLRNPLVPQCQNQAAQEVRNQHATPSKPKGDWEEYKISPGKEVAVGWIEAGKQYWIQTDHPVRVGKHRLSGTTQWYGGTISGVLIVEAEKETRIRIKPL